MLEERITSLENQLLQLKHTGKGQDVNRLPGMLMEKLSYLASTIAIVDFKPADQYAEVYEKLHGQWTALRTAWSELKAGDVAALRAELIERELVPLSVGGAGP